MKNYTGLRKEMIEAGWKRRDRGGEERWISPEVQTDDGHMTYESAVRRFKSDQIARGIRESS